jgi:hypothetical protein
VRLFAPDWQDGSMSIGTRAALAAFAEGEAEVWAFQLSRNLRSTNAATAASDFGGAPSLDRSQKKCTAPTMRSNKRDELTTNNVAMLF